nr:hypothetical protein [uncultured bacterium]
MPFGQLTVTFKNRIYFYKLKLKTRINSLVLVKMLYFIIITA